jgi:hypothetical protein
MKEMVYSHKKDNADSACTSPAPLVGSEAAVSPCCQSNSIALHVSKVGMTTYGRFDPWV